MVEETGRDSILVDLKHIRAERESKERQRRHIYHHLLSRIGRRGIFILLLIVLLSGSAFAGWKTDFWAKLSFEYNRAEMMVIVEDGETGRPLVGISVEADGRVLETDEQGKVFFDKLQKGTVTFKVSLPGFKDFFQTAGLNRGPNKELVFSLQIATAEVKGVAIDYVDGTPVVGAKVIAPGAETTTGEEGKFLLEEVIIGTPEVSISKDGYYDFSQTVELVKDVAEDLGEIKLLGKGKVVFVSDRDGKNAIYWVKLDGSDLGKIWENKAGFDDTRPYLSPDKQKIIFLSNRDNQKDEWGDLANLLYYNDLSGKSLQKLSFDIDPVLHGWLADGSGFVYESFFRGEEEEWQAELKIVEVPALTTATLAKSTDFGTGASFVAVALSPKSDWIAFMIYNYDEPEKEGIYIIHPDGTGRKSVTSGTRWALLRFSADGKKLIYKDLDSHEYYSYDIAAGTKKKIPAPTSEVGVVEILSSAQDLRAFIDYRDGKSDIYLSKKDGTSERRATFAGGVGGKIYFAGPKDRYLVYSVYLPQETAIYVIGLKEGSKPLKVTDISYGGFAGVVPE